jgi:hypothetical protein
MFNKGMLYDDYTKFIYKVLDVQRSGQCPELLLDMHKAGSLGNEHLHKDVIALVLAAKQEWPDEFGDYCDWFKVEALGALHKYPTEKQVQTAQYGEPTKPVNLPKGFSKVIGQWQVFPGQTVAVLERGKSKVSA